MALLFQQQQKVSANTMLTNSKYSCIVDSMIIVHRKKNQHCGTCDRKRLNINNREKYAQVEVGMLSG